MDHGERHHRRGRDEPEEFAGQPVLAFGRQPHADGRHCADQRGGPLGPGVLRERQREPDPCDDEQGRTDGPPQTVQRELRGGQRTGRPPPALHVRQPTRQPRHLTFRRPGRCSSA